MTTNKDAVKLVERLHKDCKERHIHKKTEHGVWNWTCVQMKAADLIESLVEERQVGIDHFIKRLTDRIESDAKRIEELTTAVRIKDLNGQEATLEADEWACIAYEWYERAEKAEAEVDRVTDEWMRDSVKLKAERDRLLKRVKQLEAAILEWRDANDALNTTAIQQEVRAEKAEAIATKMSGEMLAVSIERDRLWEYVRHSEGCNYPHGKEYGCKCGLLALDEQETKPITLQDLKDAQANYEQEVK